MAKQEKKQKRAARPKSVTYTPEFKKSWERYNRAGRRDMNAAREVMALLFLGNPLPPEYLDHELKGEWEGSRECHIGGDFLLVYQDHGELLTFVDLGSHSELFG
ncbi:type II toxin-antitoxin system YafQ family toxin [Stutzerimonas stutzeri]|uniref:type II toxin-antitoxin system YafQ family toxin n=1 Tax=Stutzerimonas stutzeri TaxID=316 RepID=UPI003B781E3A